MMNIEIRNRIIKITTDCAVEAATEALKFTAEPTEDGFIEVKTKSGEVIELLEPHINFNLHGFDYYFIQLISRVLKAEYPVG